MTNTFLKQNNGLEQVRALSVIRTELINNDGSGVVAVVVADDDDDDDDDDGQLTVGDLLLEQPMIGDLFVVVSANRETAVLKVIVIHFAEIQNWGRC